MNLQSEIGFVECLALHRNRRDTAVGLVHITSFQRGLLWYRNLLRRRQFAAMLYSPIIRGIAVRSETAPPEEQPGLLQLATEISDRVRIGRL